MIRFRVLLVFLVWDFVSSLTTVLVYVVSFPPSPSPASRAGGDNQYDTTCDDDSQTNDQISELAPTIFLLSCTDSLPPLF